MLCLDLLHIKTSLGFQIFETLRQRLLLDPLYWTGRIAQEKVLLHDPTDIQLIPLEVYDTRGVFAVDGNIVKPPCYLQLICNLLHRLTLLGSLENPCSDTNQHQVCFQGIH